MSAKTVSNKTYSVLMFLAVSVLSGVLVAGLGVPLVALAAGTTRASAEALQNLPADLAVPEQNEASEMLMADGSLLARFFDEDREYVTLDQISSEMQQAQVAIEDHRFYEHGAIDFQSVVRAALGNAAGGGVSGGGSTLTQQYVKLVRIQLCDGEQECVSEAQAQTMERKMLEMRYAIALEQSLTKDEILERYLNIAYYGDGAYGVQAAAKHYFNKNASELDVAESAMLAGLVQNPSGTDPVNNLDAALERRAAVLDAQVRYQGMPQDVADAAAAVPFDAGQVQEMSNGCPDSRYPFICDYATRVLTSDEMSSLGATYEERLNTLRRAGLTITLHIDPATQDAAQNAVSSVVGPTDAVIGVLDAVDPKTGRILAMAQSRPTWGDGEGETNWNYSVTHDMGGTEGYFFGSTFKPFTAAAAVQQGHFPDTTYYNVQKTMQWQNKTFRGCGDDTFRLGDTYSTTNAVSGEDTGNFNMVTGMMWSVNNYFISLEQTVGPCQAADMAERAGVEISYPELDENGDGQADTLSDWGQIPSFTLGSVKVSPLSMAVAYGTFANRGIRCNPIILASVTTDDGTDVPVPSADCQQTIDPQVADAINYVLQRTQTSGLSSTMYINNGIAQASKTGTSDNSASSSAFVGYTPDISASAIIAGDNTDASWADTPEQSRNVARIALTPLGSSLGNQHSGIMWKPFMETVMQGMPASQFTQWVAPAAPSGSSNSSPTSQTTR
ncbi:transglycosylase domain-containing protein [Brooklawnia cerclae]|uniref:Membrane peptidoglycan carboxypeptidase n=1 Tax=Brooklawnia cerclae TaxID=349934 RepID=A0ABX0SFC8_9ACTN|nr:membrane peptidoglycan carboxypeptidase [Brooklawnia cerclae]